MLGLADANPVAAVLAHVKAYAADSTGPGSVDFGAAEHASDRLEGPWPHVAVTPGVAGDLRDGRWDAEHEVTLQVYADPEGTVGKFDLWQRTMRLVASCVTIPDLPRAPAGPVVVDVSPSSVDAWTPLISGQGCWTVSLFVVTHPANS